MAFIRNINDLTAFTAGDATFLKEVLHPKNGDPDLGYSVAYATLEPGTASYPHRLLERTELYLFIQGSGQVIMEGAIFPVTAGSVFLIETGAMQHVENTGEKILAFYCIVSPSWKAEAEIVPD